MNPFEYWTKNKGRSDLRKLTRDFEKNFKIKSKCKFEPGKVYAITYTTDSNIPTDKHHVSPVILSMGNFRDENGRVNVRGVNLMYLTTKQIIEILNDAYLYVDKNPNERVVPIVKIHEKYLKVFPWAFKNFVNTRIRTAVEINPEEWGLISLLYKYLFGNFNPTALNEDFQIEIKKKSKFSRSLDKPLEEEKEEIEDDEEETVEMEDDLITNSDNNELYIEEY